MNPPRKLIRLLFGVSALVGPLALVAGAMAQVKGPAPLSLGISPEALASDEFVLGFDPRSHVRPPLAKYEDGEGGTFVGALRVNKAWRHSAARHAAHNPTVRRAPGQITRVGEVLILEGDATTVGQDEGGRFGIDVPNLEAIARQVIEFAGDNFEVITLWPAFDDGANNRALAYAVNIRNEVQGLGPGLPLIDRTARYGSAGRLRLMANMKSIGVRAGDTLESWQPWLPTWGQETGHRFMAFMRAGFKGKNSDILLGRDCSHYHMFVDTQASVHDGHAWRDNGNGTFSLIDSEQRFGDLDLYGMGLVPVDEMAPSFVIDDIAGYTKPACKDYQSQRPPNTVSGTRVDISAQDIVAANGPRVPALDTGYVREVQVVITRPEQSASGGAPLALAQRIDKARQWWEAWARTATRDRLLVCTQSSADCGDRRSDVKDIVVGATGVAPAHGPVSFDVALQNGGGAAATGIKTRLVVQAAGRVFESGEPRLVPDLPAGQSHTESFSLDLRGVPCGTEAQVTAWAVNDHHYQKATYQRPIGVTDGLHDDLESPQGWVVNPDGDDTGRGATWGFGTPERDVILGAIIQPAGAHGGQGAFATGIAAGTDNQKGYVDKGKVTLQSPAYPSAALKGPVLRYFASVAALRASLSAEGVEPSPDAYLQVFVRSVSAGQPTGDAGFRGADAGIVQEGSPWIQIDQLGGVLTPGWIERVAALPPELDFSGAVQFRFVAFDNNKTLGAIEAAIDDLRLTTNLPACDTDPDPALYGMVNDAGLAVPRMGGADDGCGCALGGTRRSPLGAGVFVLLFFGMALATIVWRRG